MANNPNQPRDPNQQQRDEEYRKAPGRDEQDRERRGDTDQPDRDENEDERA
jgi:hypothetical protein